VKGRRIKHGGCKQIKQIELRPRVMSYL
jgi:hypothetical protein